MADATPRLELLPGGAPGAAPVRRPRPDPPGRERVLVWLLLALLGAALAAGWQQRRERVRLEGRVEQLAAELAASRRALEAHRGHLARIRDSVGALEALVQSDPEAEVPAPSESPRP